MPVLGIVLKVSISHQLVVLQHSHPVLVILKVFSDPQRVSWLCELLNCYHVSVEILQSDVGEESNFIILVESKVDVELTRSLLLGLLSLGHCDICLL